MTVSYGDILFLEEKYKHRKAKKSPWLGIEPRSLAS